MVVEVEENWIDEGASASAYLERRKGLLERSFEFFEVVAEGPMEAGMPGAIGIDVHFEDADYQPTIQRELCLAQGPMLCALRLSAPARDNRRERLFSKISQSFSITAGLTLAQAEKFPMFTDPERLLAQERNAQRVEIPLCAVEVAVPRGWNLEMEERGAILRGSQGEIQLQRLLGTSRDPSAWMESQLRRLRKERGARLLGWSQGEVSEHGAFTAMFTDETADTRTWQSAATQKTLRLMITEREPLEWTVKSVSQDPADSEAILGQLIGGTRFLEPERWRTEVVVPWSRAVLEGPWTSTTAGMYIHPESHFPMFELRSQEVTRPLARLRPELLEAMRTGFGIAPGSKTEKEELGVFRGFDAFRYAGDGQLSVRGLWFAHRDSIYTCLLQMRRSSSTDNIFKSLIDSLSFPII